VSTALFRRKALERVSSPEQLDRVVRAALPLQWVALVALLLVVAAAVAWAVIATVPTTLSGAGIYLPVGGLHPASTPIAGTVTASPALTVGAQVSEGQVLATVTPPVAQGTPGPPPSYPVSSPLTGVVVTSYPLSGTFEGAGQVLGLVQPTDRPLVVYSYVSDQTANGLSRGTEVQVDIAGLGGAYGYAKGKVAAVSQYPVDPESVQSLTNNSSLVDVLTSLGPTKEVIVSMTPASTPSGIAWGRGQGPPGRLPPGLPADPKFIVGSHHPISNVI
jgi:hypothetical protein